MRKSAKRLRAALAEIEQLRKAHHARPFHEDLSLWIRIRTKLLKRFHPLLPDRASAAEWMRDELRVRIAEVERWDDAYDKEHADDRDA